MLILYIWVIVEVIVVVIATVVVAAAVRGPRMFSVAVVFFVPKDAREKFTRNTNYVHRIALHEFRCKARKLTFL